MTNSDQSDDHYREDRRDRLMAEADAEYDRLTVTPTEWVTPIVSEDHRDVSMERVKAIIKSCGITMAIALYGSGAVDEAMES